MSDDDLETMLYDACIERDRLTTENQRLTTENQRLTMWANAMPDAGLTVDDPRYAWWVERPCAP